MRLFYFILLVAAIKCIRAQDTIYKRSGDCLAANIIEVTPYAVKYKKIENVTGPLYVTDKTDILFIKYKNGSVDTFKLNDSYRQPEKFNAVSDTNKIYIVGKNLFYKYHRLNNNDLLRLISFYPDEVKRNSMMNDHKQLRRNNRNRYTFGIIGIAMVPLGCLIAAGISSLGDDTGAEGAAVAYFLIGSVSVGISQFCNYRYHNKKKHIIATYNTF